MESKRESFRLLDLPLPVFKCILDQLNPVFILELTFRSKVLKWKVQMVQLNMPSIKWNVSCFHKGVLLECDQNKLEIKIISENDEPSREVMTVNGAKVPSQRTDERIELNALDESKEMKLLEELTQHLFNVLNFSGAKLRCHIDHFTNMKTFFLWRFSRNFFEFKFIYGGNSTNLLTSDEMTFMMENLQFVNLTLDVHMENFKYTNSIATTSLNVNFCLSWVDTNRVLDFNCPKIAIRPDEYQADMPDLNAILKQWQEMKDDSLEYLFIGFHTEQSSDVVFRGIDSKPTVFKFVDYSLRAKLRDLPAHDIERKTDGRMATIFLGTENCEVPYAVEFLVWHEKNLKFCCRETKQRFNVK